MVGVRRLERGDFLTSYLWRVSRNFYRMDGQTDFPFFHVFLNFVSLLYALVLATVSATLVK